MVSDVVLRPLIVTLFVADGKAWFDDLALQDLRRLGVFVQVIVELLCKELNNEVSQRNTRFDLLRAQFDLGLGFENRIGYTDRNGGNDRSTDIGRIVILMIELLDGLGDRLAKSRLVRTTL